jgi:hypothetical protein
MTDTVRAFGEWDAPMTDDAEWIEVPTDLACMLCGERFVEGDNGAITPGGPQHRECGLRGVMGGIGHLVDHAFFCHGELGTDAGLSYRASALLTWNALVLRRVPTRDELLLLGGHFDG